MAHIYIYSPSGAVRDRAAFGRGVKRLQAMGHAVEVDPDALSGHQRFAGDDATRLQAIARAAASRADVALISRGGYGLTRLLPRLPYRALARAAERGTRFVGISDFTALQLALLAQTGAVTWAGPALIEGFGQAHGGDGKGNVPDAIMLACFDDLLQGVGEGAGWRLPTPRQTAGMRPTPANWHLEAATLWGGNLTLLTALLGTPYFPQISGGILFLEDVGEHPYRIERMLGQLLHAGVLERQKAVLLGRFTAYTATPHDKGFNLHQVFIWLSQQLKKVPVLTGLPYGHVPTKILLPVGQPVDLLVREREALLLWPHRHDQGH
ncbi:MAG: LD-carboxypeptidase [Burkholderiaceae bacterium]|jgi:muramoyltetrapeptide carboxypeptidase|nr:LD-carboxypeptidase [Burkholderiaceae bacterium]